MKRLPRNAFTLVEVIVVVIVLGILMAVVVPRFFGASGSSKDNVAKQYLTVAWRELAAQQTANNGVWPAAVSLAAQANIDEPELSFVAAPAASAADATNSKAIYVELTGNDGIKLGIKSASGTVITAIADSTTNYQLSFTTGPGTDQNGDQNGGSVSRGLPLNTGPPSLNALSGSVGAPQLGDILAIDHGTWSGSPSSYAYVWERDGSAISGATTTSYTVSSDDTGHALSVAVTATNSKGATSANSDSSGVVGGNGSDAPVSAAPAYTARPTVTSSGSLSTPQVDDRLTATDGTWTGAPTFTYQWLRDGGPVGSATASTYTIGADDTGHALTIRVTATNDIGTDTASSLATGVVGGGGADTSSPPSSTAAPTIGDGGPGTMTAPKVGDQLTATLGDWNGNPTSYSHIWRRDGHSVSGQTLLTYTIVAADVGHALRIHVTATNSDGSAAADSDPTGTVTGGVGAPSNTAMPTISGTAQVGETLSATHGAWSGIPTSYSYQWYNCNYYPDPTDTNYCVARLGATSAQYTIESLFNNPELNQVFRVTVIATNSSGSSAAVWSAPTDLVADSLPVNTAVPTISGTPQMGVFISGTVGTWDNMPSNYEFTYQWQRCSDGLGYTYLNDVYNDSYGGSPYGPAVLTLGMGDWAFGAEPYDIGYGTVGAWDGTGINFDTPGLVVEQDVTTWMNPTDSAATFDGSGTLTVSDQAYIDNSGGWLPTSLIDPQATANVEVWVKPSSVAGTSTILDKPGSYRLRIVSGHAEFSAFIDGDWQSATGATTLAVGNTYQLVGNYDGATVNVYVNGAEDGSAFYSGSLSDSYGNDLTIGQDYQGVLDDISIDPDTALSAAQIAQHYADGAPLDQSGCVNISGASGGGLNGANTAQYYVGSDDYYSGGKLRLIATASNNAGTVTAVSAKTVTVLPPLQPPNNTVAPVISGGPAVPGVTLTVSTGTWANSPTEYYIQWYSMQSGVSGWAPVAGAGGWLDTTYTVTTNDAGHSFYANVTATNSGGSTNAMSNIVNPAGPTNTGLPVISGATPPLLTGTMLTTSNGSWSVTPTSYSYQWQRSPDGSTGWTSANGSNTSSSYYIDPATQPQGAYLRVAVTATLSGASTTAYSAATSMVHAPPLNTGPPSISGSVHTTQVLTTSLGSWGGIDPPTSYTYQWQHSANGTSGWANATGTGATTGSYTVDASDLHDYLRVNLTGINAYGSTATTSAATVQDQPFVPGLSVAPSLGGVFLSGSTVSVSNGTWTTYSPITSYAYQWQIASDGASYSDISGATASTYVVPSGDAAQWLRVVMIVTNSDGSTSYNTYGNQVAAAGTYDAVVAADSPIAYWRLDDQGSTVVAQAGGDNGTIVGPVTSSATGAKADDSPNRALNFAGTDPNSPRTLVPGYVDLGSPTYTFSGTVPAFSVEAWVKPVCQLNGADGVFTTPTWTMVATAGVEADNCTDGGYGGYGNYFFVGTATKDATGTGPLSLNGWHYLVATTDGVSISRAYIDGVLVGQGAFNSNTWWGSSHNSAIGAWWGNNGFDDFFTGLIDNVAIYGAPLSCGTTTVGQTCTSSSQIYKHYHG